MPDSATVKNVLAQDTREAAIRTALRRAGAGVGITGRTVLWLAVIIAGIAALAPVTRYARQEADTWFLLQSGQAGGQPIVPSADNLEALSELSTDPEAALLAARQAVAADPSRAFAWARIAWLESSKAGKVAATSLDALAKSMDVCPLCSEDLIRWRFNFVLTHWPAMPEPVRARAFEHANFLGWSSENAEFLAEMRIKSELAGIPFATYRAAVKSPVKALDLPPPASVVGSPAAAPGG
jgi:hypothetical protein